MSAPVDPDERARVEALTWSQRKALQMTERLRHMEQALVAQAELLDMPDAKLMAGIERWYSISEAAQFFGRSNQWLYLALKNKKLRYRDGTPIEPIVLDGSGWRRLTLPLIKEIAESCYRSGWVKLEELKAVLRRIAEAQFEEVLCDPQPAP